MKDDKVFAFHIGADVMLVKAMGTSWQFLNPNKVATAKYHAYLAPWVTYVGVEKALGIDQHFVPNNLFRTSLYFVREIGALAYIVGVTQKGTMVTLLATPFGCDLPSNAKIISISHWNRLMAALEIKDWRFNNPLVARMYLRFTPGYLHKMALNRF